MLSSYEASNITWYQMLKTENTQKSIFEAKSRQQNKMTEIWVMKDGVTSSAIDSAKATVKTMSEAVKTRASTGQRNVIGGMELKTGGPSIKQPTFDITAKDPYRQLKILKCM